MSMRTGQTIRGGAHLVFDAVDQVTGIVEGMYRNITAVPLPFGPGPEAPAGGIAGFVHETIRQVNGGVRGVSDLALGPLSEHLDAYFPPGAQREAAVSLLNGLCGDHLARSGNPLAIPLGFRILRGEEEPLTFDEACGASDFVPTNRILVLAHGLCMNDRHWSWEGHNHGQMLAESFGYSPLYLRYNSGRHISFNGRDFDAALDRVVRQWPVPVESVTIVGFSMGGLVTRAAMRAAADHASEWVRHVDRVVYVGSPHHGAALERGGFKLQQLVGLSPYTAPLAALGRMRSDGITDLRHGNLLDEDWRYHDEHEDPDDHRRVVPLPAGCEHYAIAATLSENTFPSVDHLLSDGLVQPESATGWHPDPEKRLAFAGHRVRVIAGRGHLGMLNDPDVAATLRSWLA